MALKVVQAELYLKIRLEKAQRYLMFDVARDFMSAVSLQKAGDKLVHVEGALQG